jgi:large subunit ribosomal protein L10
MAHVAESKKKVVHDLAKLIDEYPIVGAVNMQNLPTKQVQKMRASLRQKVKIRMAKRRIMKIAFKECKKQGMDALIPYLQGMPALLFTKENPFKIASELRKSKSAAVAKAGQIAPKDIVVPAGPTPFSPGPIISQLAKVGIKAGIDKGKIAIKEDSTVVRKGDKISAEIAGILARLKIEPMEMGLDLMAIYENGIIFTSDVLNVDEKVYMERLFTAVAQARELSMEIGYVTKDNVGHMLARAYRQAKEVSTVGKIMTTDNLADMLAQAAAEAQAVSDAAAPETHPKGKPEPKKEEKSEEEVAAGLGALFG